MFKSVEYLTELHTKPIPRDTPAKHLNKSTDKRELVQDFIIKIITEDNKEVVICVPRSYRTDGASIPRFFHGIYHPFTTESYWAAVIHDYIYSDLYYKFSKEFADNLFKEMIKRDGGSWFMQEAFYRAVRMNIYGGGWHG